MQFQVRCKLEYDIPLPSTLILNIHAQRNSSQTIIGESLEILPKMQVEEFSSEAGGNRFVRIETGRKKTLSVNYEATVETTHHVLPTRRIDETPIAELSYSAIPYLFPSRYCQSDKLGRLAWDSFGKIVNPYERVYAVVDWIYDNVEYVRGSTNSETSAYDTVTQRTGVCRDFAHLGIALCRSLNIPARYFSGYAYQLVPPDIHACFECYLGGRWLVFDATRHAPLNGLVRIASGFDAADCSIANIFGRANFKSMEVDCRPTSGQKFTPLSHKQAARKGISLESPTAS